MASSTAAAAKTGSPSASGTTGGGASIGNARRAIIFDLGGVVLHSPFAGIERYERTLGLPANYINVTIASHAPGGAFQQLERGELDMDAFYPLFEDELRDATSAAAYGAYAQRRGLATTGGGATPDALGRFSAAAMFFQMMLASSRPNHDFVTAILALRGRGYLTAALTNNFNDGGGAGTAGAGLARLAPLFDTIVESRLVGLRKPDPKIYALACERLGVAPSEAVFLDDIGGNLKPAKKMGMATIRVRRGRERDALRALGGALGLPRPALVPRVDAPVELRVPCGAGRGRVAVSVFADGGNDGAGCGGHPVVFLHGGGQTRHAWESTCKALARDGFTCVSVDLKGHGDSYWDPAAAADDDADPKAEGWGGAYSLASFAADLDRLVGALPFLAPASGGGPPPFVVGASLGGQTALLSKALLGGGRGARACAGLVLVDITPTMELAGVQRIVGWMLEKASEGFASLEEAARAVAAYQPHRTRPVNLRTLRKNLRRKRDGRWYWHWDPRFLSGHTPEARQRMREALRIKTGGGGNDERYRDGDGTTVQIPELVEAAKALAAAPPAGGRRVPCLLVRGARSDLVGRAGVAEFRALVPHAAYVDVKEAAHMVAGDDQDAFLAAVRGFLIKHRDGGGDELRPRL